VDDLVHVEPVFGWSFLLEQRTDAAEHGAGASTVLDNSLDGLACLLEVGRIGGEPFDAGVPMGDDGGERLVDFMRDRCGEFAMLRTWER